MGAELDLDDVIAGHPLAEAEVRRLREREAKAREAIKLGLHVLRDRDNCSSPERAEAAMAHWLEE